MTLPANITLPLNQSDILSGDPEKLYSYIRQLVYVLTANMQISNAIVNGSANLLTDTQNPLYTFIMGSTFTGITTYLNTTMWAFRSNLLTLVNFDVSWTGTTSTGDVLIQTPYYVLNSVGFPFVGSIESDSIPYTAGYTYLTANIIPNTNTIQVNQCGSGMPVIPLPLTATGHLRGSIIYEGQLSR